MPGLTTYADLLARVRTLVAELGRTPVVGISGHGGAGKTTLAARLAGDLGLLEEQVVSTDRFYARGAGPASGMEDLHDWAALLDLLHRVRRPSLPSPPAGPERSPRLVHPVREWDGVEGVWDVAMPHVVLVEGIRLLGPRTHPLLDLGVWIDLAPDVAALRALRRNEAQGDSQAELDLWSSKGVPEGEVYARTVRPERWADVVVAAAGPR